MGEWRQRGEEEEPVETLEWNGTPAEWRERGEWSDIGRTSLHAGMEHTLLTGLWRLSYCWVGGEMDGGMLLLLCGREKM